MGIRHTWHHSISFIMYKDHHTQWAGQCLHHHLELSSPVLLDFILTAWLHSIETPRATIPCTELNDEVAFDGLFSNYENSSPPKIWRNHTEMLEEEMLTLELWYLTVEEMLQCKRASYIKLHRWLLLRQEGFVTIGHESSEGSLRRKHQHSHHSQGRRRRSVGSNIKMPLIQAAIALLEVKGHELCQGTRPYLF